MKEYRVVHGKKFSYGFTTGTCAAGASKAAVMMLLKKKRLDWVDIKLPSGEKISLEITGITEGDDFVKCAVIKDGGDDPDVTHGMGIYCTARFSDVPNEVKIIGGVGVGRITLPGLKIPVGEAAINPVPREMIDYSVREILPQGVGVTVTISVPDGVEVAKKTYNPRLGIVDGISILGTSGVVVPMSEEAWRDAIEQEISILKARGATRASLVFGNYGENYAKKHLAIPQKKIIKISNFVGYFLEKSVEYDIRKIVFVGHIGKLIKVSAGIFNTHSKVADARMEVLTSHLAMAGAPRQLLLDVYHSKTTDGALSLIKEAGFEYIFKTIANRCSERCFQYTHEQLEVATVLFGNRETYLAKSDNCDTILEELLNE